MVKSPASSTQSHLIHSQEQGHGLMALDGAQPKIASERSITMKPQIKYSASHLCSHLHSYRDIQQRF